MWLTTSSCVVKIFMHFLILLSVSCELVFLWGKFSFLFYQCARVRFPYPDVSEGCAWRGWESPNSDEGTYSTLWYSLYIRTLWSPPCFIAMQNITKQRGIVSLPWCLWMVRRRWRIAPWRRRWWCRRSRSGRCVWGPAGRAPPTEWSSAVHRKWTTFHPSWPSEAVYTVKKGYRFSRTYEVHPKSNWKMWIKREWLQLGG